MIVHESMGFDDLGTKMMRPPPLITPEERNRMIGQRCRPIRSRSGPPTLAQLAAARKMAQKTGRYIRKFSTGVPGWGKGAKVEYWMCPVQKIAKVAPPVAVPVWVPPGTPLTKAASDVQGIF